MNADKKLARFTIDATRDRSKELKKVSALCNKSMRKVVIEAIEEKFQRSKSE